MKKTLTQRNLEFLQAHGWSVDPNGKTGRYITLSKPGWDHHYFLGKAGAVRRGSCVTKSFSVKLRQVIIDPVDAAKLQRIEAKYSTEAGATEAERQEAQAIVEGSN